MREEPEIGFQVGGTPSPFKAHRLQKRTAEIEIPRRLRAIVRSRESNILVVAAFIGAAAGVTTGLMGLAVDLLHQLFFDVPPGQRLSALASLNPLFAILVPTLGGIGLGITTALLAQWRPGREIDPIEANALHGGRMSLRGSLIVAAQTVWSSGCGASVGLEAGYTQLASGIASRVGRAFRLRRADLRILVGCGAAAGIAGAFDAPLAGAFYGFELVIGTYSVRSLAPVGLAAVVGSVVAKSLAPASPGIIAPQADVILGHDLVIAAILGLATSLLGIMLMRAVALSETLFTRLTTHPWLRCGTGGLLVGLMALLTPQVMSSGHGALRLTGLLDEPGEAIATILVLKAAASIVSLGAGFRGGLFFSSLLMGALAGRLFATVLDVGFPQLDPDPNLYAMAGMSGLAASVIGGPFTMVFIALESTGNLWFAAVVLVTVIVSAQVTRELFGYSFATWRFHLRGETILGPADVGWMRDLTVGRMMRRDPPTIAAETTIAALRQAFPVGSTGQVLAVDAQGRYAGLIVVAEAHAADIDPESFVFTLLQNAGDMLTPSMTLQQALIAFDRAETEVLAVVDAPASRRVLGLLSEAHGLRRYLSELELRRRELAGEG